MCVCLSHTARLSRMNSGAQVKAVERVSVFTTTPELSGICGLQTNASRPAQPQHTPKDAQWRESQPFDAQRPNLQESVELEAE